MVTDRRFQLNRRDVMELRKFRGGAARRDVAHNVMIRTVFEAMRASRKTGVRWLYAAALEDDQAAGPGGLCGRNAERRGRAAPSPRLHRTIG